LASASYGLWRYPDRARINPQDVTGGSTWHSVIQKIKVLFGGAPKPALARALPNGPKWSSSRQGAAPGAVQNGAAPGNEPQPASTWEVESPNKAPPAPRSFSRLPPRARYDSSCYTNHEAASQRTDRAAVNPSIPWSSEQTKVI